MQTGGAEGLLQREAGLGLDLPHGRGRGTDDRGDLGSRTAHDHRQQRQIGLLVRKGVDDAAGRGVTGHGRRRELGRVVGGQHRVPEQPSTDRIIVPGAWSMAFPVELVPGSLHQEGPEPVSRVLELAQPPGQADPGPGGDPLDVRTGDRPQIADELRVVIGVQSGEGSFVAGARRLHQCAQILAGAVAVGDRVELPHELLLGVVRTAARLVPDRRLCPVHRHVVKGA